MTATTKTAELAPDAIETAGKTAAAALWQLAKLSHPETLEAKYAAVEALLTKRGVFTLLTDMLDAMHPDLTAHAEQAGSELGESSITAAANAVSRAVLALAEARDDLDHALTMLKPLVG